MLLPQCPDCQSTDSLKIDRLDKKDPKYIFVEYHCSKDGYKNVSKVAKS